MPARFLNRGSAVFLVHAEAKPLPCIHHACYENEKDLPPDELLAEHEGLVNRI